MRQSALLLLLVAPLDALLAQQPATRRDSAGIALVQNAPPRAGDQTPFVVASAPRVQIGREDSATYQFNGITSATKLRNGDILVADQGSAELRIFGPLGQFKDALGRRGDGPGEFRALSFAWESRGDTVRAWDSQGIGTSFGPGRPAVVRTFRFHSSESERPFAAGLVRGIPPESALFAYRLARASIPVGNSVTRDTMVVERYTASGMLLGSVGRFLGLEVLQGGGGSIPSPAGETQGGFFSRTGVPFAREALLRTGRRGLYVVSADGTGQIARYDTSGRLTMIIRSGRSPRPVTPEMIRQHRLEPRGPMSFARPNVSTSIASGLYPTSLPVYSAILVDPSDRIWLRLHPVPGESLSRWDVIDDAGNMLGTVSMPPAFELLEVGNTYVLGVWRDDLDVEHVREYPLSRTTTTQ